MQQVIPLEMTKSVLAEVAARAGTVAHAAATTSTSSAPIFIVPNGTFFPELILFMIVLGVVAKFILPPIQAAMDDREKAVRSALTESDEGQIEAVRLARERAVVLDTGRGEARSLLEAAGRDAEAAIEAARAAGRAEHDRLIAQATPAIESERERVRAELSGRLGELVVAAAERVVGIPVDATRHAGVIGEAVAAAQRTGV